MLRLRTLLVDGAAQIRNLCIAVGAVFGAALKGLKTVEFGFMSGGDGAEGGGLVVE